MTDRGPRPFPGDPDAEHLKAMFDLRGTDTEWLLTAGGEYQTGAAEVMSSDGSNWQRVVLLEWPSRVNHEHGPGAERPLHLMISPEDAIGLAQVLAHTGSWLLRLPT